MRRKYKVISREPAGALPLVLLPAVLWLSRYMYALSFGLYEDDYSRIPLAIGMGFNDLTLQLLNIFSQQAGHGLPIHLASIFTLSFIGSKFAGLHGIYLLGFIITSLNAILFYLLIRRIATSGFALICGLTFCLFSADTTQAYLTHSLGLQPSLMFFMLAAHSFLAGKKTLAYLLAIGILLTYETPFPLLYAIPMLQTKWDRRLLNEVLRNSAVLSMLILCILLLRLLLGEGRITGLGFPEAALVSLRHMLQGPPVSLGTYLYRPVQTLLVLDLDILIVILGSWLIFFGLFKYLDLTPARFHQLRFDPRPRIDKLLSRLGFSGSEDGLSNSFLANYLPILLLGLTLLVLAYPLTFTVRAYAISGRETRVHFAGIVGASIVWATLLYLIRDASIRLKVPNMGMGVIAALLALTMGFGTIIQKDYAASWRLQREFWQDTLELTPDLTKGTIILVDPSALEDTRYIGANVWNLPLMLERIYNFPGEWGLNETPRMYRLTPDWKQHVLGDEGLFHLNARTTVAPRSYDRAVDPANVILILGDHHQLKRVENKVALQSTFITLKPLSSPYLSYEEGILHDLLLEN